MTKYAEWGEPWPIAQGKDVDVVLRMTVTDAIRYQRSKDERYVDLSDDQVLSDFIAVHWAVIKEYEE